MCFAGDRHQALESHLLKLQPLAKACPWARGPRDLRSSARAVQALGLCSHPSGVLAEVGCWMKTLGGGVRVKPLADPARGQRLRSCDPGKRLPPPGVQPLIYNPTEAPQLVGVRTALNLIG